MIFSSILAQATAASDSIAISAESMQAAIASLSGLTVAEIVEYLVNAGLTLGSKIIQINTI